MGNVKHEALIIEDIKKCLDTNGGIITQEQVVNIISKYYSKGYSQDSGLKLISRALSKQQIAIETKVKLPSSISIKLSTATNSPNMHFITLFISTQIPEENRQNAAKDFIKNMLHTFITPLSRSVSKEILEENQPLPQPKVSDTDFFSLRLRSMLLHLFLLTTFKSEPFTIQDIRFCIPIGLSMQILRDIDPKYFILNPSILVPLENDKSFEIETILSMLKPPYNQLIINNTVLPTAEIDIEHMNFHKKYDFVNDPLAHFQYWSLISAINNELPTHYPISISQRFDRYVLSKIGNTSLYCLPFFPRDVEQFAWENNVPIPAVSFVLQKLFKKKLKQIQYSRHSFLEGKLFPSSGTAAYLITLKTALPIPPLYIPQFFDGEIETDDSLQSLAKVLFAGRLSTDGYVMRKNGDFFQLNEVSDKWIKTHFKVGNLISSLFEIDEFVQLYNLTAANVLVQIHDVQCNEDDDCDIINASAKEILDLFSISKRFIDIDHSTAVAIEFLKPILSDISINRNNNITVRQLIHLRQSDLGSAVSMLSALGVYFSDNRRICLKFPKTSWYFKDFNYLRTIQPEKYHSVLPRPGLFYFIEDESSCCSLDWPGMHNIITIFLGDENNEFTQMRKNSKIYEFSLKQERFKLPKPEIKEEEQQIPPREEKQNTEILTTDPLFPFAFGRIELESYLFSDLTHRYLFNLIGGSEVDGIGIIELANSFDCTVNSETMETIMKDIEMFIRLNLIVRMPSANLEPYWSRYKACGSLVKETTRKIETVPVHMWMTHDGKFNNETIYNLRSNLTTFILAHPDTTFEDLMEKFSYVSPYDLCIILEALECDEVIHSTYYYESESSLFDLGEKIPTQSPQSIDIFLGILAEQRLIEPERKLVRRIKTQKSSLFNLCL